MTIPPIGKPSASQHQQDDAKEKGRHRPGEQSIQQDAGIQAGAAPPGSDHAQRNAQEDRQKLTQHDQHHRPPDAFLEQFGDILAGGKGDAQVAVEQVANIGRELGIESALQTLFLKACLVEPDRFVQTKVHPDAFLGFSRHARAVDDQLDRVTGQDAEKEKIKNNHHQQGGNCKDNFSDQDNRCVASVSSHARAASWTAPMHQCLSWIIEPAWLAAALLSTGCHPSAVPKPVKRSLR